MAAKPIGYGMGVLKSFVHSILGQVIYGLPVSRPTEYSCVFCIDHILFYYIINEKWTEKGTGGAVMAEIHPGKVFRTIYMAAVLYISCSVFHVSAQLPESNYNYAAVISESAYAEEGWKRVADSLVSRHGLKGNAELFLWGTTVTDLRSELSEFRPDYIGYIARPVTDCNAAFVAAVSRLSRNLDDDPYGDAVWGIITGYEAEDALRVISESLEIRTVLLASNGLPYEPPLQRFYQGIGMVCESYTETNYLFPGRGGEVYTEDRRPEGEQDRIKLVSKWMNAESLDITINGEGTISGPIDCIVTGGHGNVNLWQCHYPDAGNEGYMQSSGGRLYGAPHSGSSIPIDAPTPKVFWCASNCLMGNPNRIDNIVYAAFHTGHAVQMYGFVNSASTGDEFMAWGFYDRVTKFAGKHSFAEGFFIAGNTALFEIEHPSGHFTTSRVRLFLDSTVVYGDPAAEVAFHDFGDGAKAFREELHVTEGQEDRTQFTLTITAVTHEIQFSKGYCYQFRPVRLLPVRIDPSTVAIDGNEGHTTEITDNLVIWEMLADGEILQKGASKTLEWSADVTADPTGILDKRETYGVFSSPRTVSAVAGPGFVTVAVNNAGIGELLFRIVGAGGRCRAVHRCVIEGNGNKRLRIPVELVPGVYYIFGEGRTTAGMCESFIVTR